jgi:SAM-dependent methyltransferase
MKLSELVGLRNLLNESIALEEVRASTEILLQRISSVGDTISNADYVASVHRIRDYYAEILTLVEKPPRELHNMLSQIDAKINKLTKDFHKRGYIINGFFASNSTDVDGERNLRTVPVASDIKKLVGARIDMHSSWKYPGLEIGPGDGEWTPMLVASDPLFVIDNHQEFLDVTSSQFPDDYQRRLRKYVIDFRTNDIMDLPHNQIGFAFAWNVFNFFPEYELRHYLAQVFNLLRPGATLLFSYNNCDNPTQAGFAEEGWMSWMPRTLLTSVLTDLGYTDFTFFEPAQNISFVEVKKPGEKTTVKAHQVLGEIKFLNS